MSSDKNTLLIAKRLEVVQTSLKLGLRKTEELYGVTKKTIISWKKRYLADGEASLGNRESQAGKKTVKISVETAGEIQILFANNPTLSAAQIKKQLNLNCSIPTILKRMRSGVYETVKSNASYSWQISITRAGKSDTGAVCYLYTAYELESGIGFFSLSLEKSLLQLQIFMNRLLFSFKDQIAEAGVLIYLKPSMYNKLVKEWSYLDFLQQVFLKVQLATDNKPKPLLDLSKELKFKSNQSVESYLKHLGNLFLFSNYLKLDKWTVKSKLRFITCKPVLISGLSRSDMFKSIQSGKERELLDDFSELLTLLNDFNSFKSYFRYLDVIECFLVDLICALTGAVQYSGVLINVFLLQSSFYFQQRKFEQSRISLEQALALSDEAKNSYLMTECNIRLAETELKLRHSVFARRNLTRALVLAKKNRQTGQVLAILALTGHLHESMLNYYAAKTIYNQQFELAVENNNPREYCLALSSKARLLFLNGFFDKAITSAEKCLSLALKYSTNSVICSLYSTLGLGKQEKKLLHQAEKEFYHQLEYAEKSGDYQLIAQALSNLGYCECLLNDFELGNQKMEAAYKLCQKENDQAGIIKALGFFAKSSVLAGNYKKAVFFYSTILKQKEYFGTIEQLPNYYGNLTICYLKLKKTAQAMEIAAKRYDLVKFSGNRQQISLAISKLGAVYLGLKRYKEAVKCFREQIMILRSLGDKAGLSVAYSNLAETYALQKKGSMAEKYQKKSDSIAAEIDSEVFLSLI